MKKVVPRSGVFVIEERSTEEMSRISELGLDLGVVSPLRKASGYFYSGSSVRTNLSVSELMKRAEWEVINALFTRLLKVLADERSRH